MKRLGVLIISLLMVITPLGYAGKNDLTDNNTVLSATGQFGNGADFELDNNEWLSITDATQTDLDLVGNYTILMWLKQETTGSGSRVLWHKGASWAIIGNNVADKVTVRHVNASNQTVANTAFGSSFVHWGSTFDGTTFTHYNNGTADGSATHIAITDTASDWALGGVGAAPFDGILDEVVIFKRVLSGAEMNDIRLNGWVSFTSGGDQTDVVSVWLMDEASGTRVDAIEAVVVRNRVFTIIIALHMSLFAHIIHNYGLVNKHRTKFGISKPSWFKVFEMRQAFADVISDKVDALIEFAKRDDDQVKDAKGRFKQKWPVVKNGLTYETHEYLGPRGAGYIQRVIRTDDVGKDWVLEKHVGPETDRDIAKEWRELE